ncbi:hypothetical protein DXG03_004724 [Asterophora parasitica]|uniref:Uncharacterized protein n=1 Tax=Asterophora parasitica TaxID=117018 RepID=A0A9P7GAT2_9AGAR|nr:hypothetical protein DXG03_004724 [Asterophora parasitica]
MASRQAAPPLAERADIHKSCKSLETLLNVLNDYCEAAGAAVLLQKKLAKALRDAAGMKTTGEIAANTMNASATIFEASFDIDSKFAKIADKEYGSFNAEVKKWFKKLAKEERTHDERMANANTRIKQAEGQVYEKKSKKNPRDATEEHARYINLITALGPEISQEKYNHSFNVSQRHASTTSNAAACLARVADAEWLRTCEGVRRFSPTIGPLGEWRALCEGSWSGPVPRDLPDLDESQRLQPNREDLHEQRPHDEDLQPPTTIRSGNPRESTKHARAGHYIATEAEPEASRDAPIVLHSPANQQSSSDSTLHTASNVNHSDSIRSLSAFPLPPTHFPIPPPRRQQSQLESQSSQSSSSANLPRLTESPLAETEEGSNDQLTAPVMHLPPQYASAPTPVPSPQQPFREKPAFLESTAIPTSHVAEDNNLKQPIPIGSQASLPTESYKDTPGPAHSNPEGVKPDTDREFGVNVAYMSKAHAAETPKSPFVERTGTGGSVVAAMRNRYSSTSGAISPAPKDAPRLPLSVNELASRYHSTDGPPSPPLRTPSLSTRQLPVPPANTDAGNQVWHGGPPYHEPISPARTNMHATIPSTSGSPVQGRRQQRLNDLARQELKEKETHLLEWERDVEQRKRDLERDLARLSNAQESGNEHRDGRRESPGDGASQQPYNPIRPRERKTSFRNQRPQSQLDIGSIGYPSTSTSGSTQNLGVSSNPQHSYSTSHLVLPSLSSHPTQPSTSQSGKQSLSSSSYQQSKYSHSPTFSNPSTHAPYCGCEKCSAAKYRTPQTPPALADLRPPAEPISLRPTEKSSKPRWMRRLSMPVGGAFGLGSEPSKKGLGIQHIAGQGQGKNAAFSMDGKKNVSSSVLRAKEDGRRSYDAAVGGGNGSTTNLGAVRR